MTSSINNNDTYSHTTINTTIDTSTSTPTTTTANATASSPPPLGEKGTSTMSTAGGVLDFGRASVGVEIVRMVTLQNVGKSPAVFCVDAPELKQVRTGARTGLGGNTAPGRCRTKVYTGMGNLSHPWDR